MARYSLDNHVPYYGDVKEARAAFLASGERSADVFCDGKRIAGLSKDGMGVWYDKDGRKDKVLPDGSLEGSEETRERWVWNESEVGGDGSFGSLEEALCAAAQGYVTDDGRRIPPLSKTDGFRILSKDGATVGYLVRTRDRLVYGHDRSWRTVDERGYLGAKYPLNSKDGIVPPALKDAPMYRMMQKHTLLKRAIDSKSAEEVIPICEGLIKELKEFDAKGDSVKIRDSLIRQIEEMIEAAKDPDVRWTDGPEWERVDDVLFQVNALGHLWWSIEEMSDFVDEETLVNMGVEPDEAKALNDEIQSLYRHVRAVYDDVFKKAVLRLKEL